MSNTTTSTQSVKHANPVFLEGGNIIANFEANMLQVQMAVTQDLDDQYRDVAKKIKFLSTVKEVARENMAKLQEFTAKNHDKAKSNGREILKLTPAQMAELLGSLKEVHYNVEDQIMEVVPMMIFDSGDAHKLDELPKPNNYMGTGLPPGENSWVNPRMPQTPMNGLGPAYPNSDDLQDVATDSSELSSGSDATDAVTPDSTARPVVPITDGKASPVDYQEYMEQAAALGNSKEAAQMIDKLGGEGSDRFFYGDKAGYTFADGTPRISVWVDGLEALKQKMENDMKKVDSQFEELTAKLDQLSGKRKAALDAMGDIMRKFDEARTNTVGKL